MARLWYYLCTLPLAPEWRTPDRVEGGTRLTHPGRPGAARQQDHLTFRAALTKSNTGSLIRR